MCKKYISVADISNDDESVDHRRIAPFVTEAIQVVDGETELIAGVEIHKKGICRKGGKICSLCDNFNIERIEVPACPKRCKCRVNSQQIEAMKKSPKGTRDLDSAIENQVNHACQKIIIGVRQKYPERHVVIVDCGIFVGVEYELVFAEILVFKRPKLLKEIDGNSNCKCQTKSIVDSMKMGMFGSAPGTDIHKQTTIVEENGFAMGSAMGRAHAHFMFQAMVHSMFMSHLIDHDDDEDDHEDEDDYSDDEDDYDDDNESDWITTDSSDSDSD